MPVEFGNENVSSGSRWNGHGKGNSTRPNIYWVYSHSL